MNELQNAIKLYQHVNFPGCNTAYAELVKSLNQINEFERPDGFIILEDTLYLIEHFEFDSSKVNKKGAQDRREFGRIKRTLDGYPVNTIYHDTVKGDRSISQYLENLLCNFRNHYKNIDLYIDNIKKHISGFSYIKFGFFIEDTTIFGNSYKLKEKDSFPNRYSLHLAYCKEFIDLFEESKKLDFCFCSISNSKNRSLDLINKENIYLYREAQIECSQIELINFSTNTSGANILLSY